MRSKMGWQKTGSVLGVLGVTLGVVLILSVLQLASEREGNRTYRHSFGDVYFDPAIGKQISHSFVVTNDFSDTPIRLKVAGKSCSCTTSGIEDKVVPPGKSTRVTLSYNADSSIVDVEQTVHLSTGAEALPLIALKLCGRTIPLASLTISNRVVPRVELGHSFRQHVAGTIYTYTDKPTVQLSSNDPDLHVEELERKVSKIDETMWRVDLTASLVIEHSVTNVSRMGYRSAKVSLTDGRVSTSKTVNWHFVCPFQISPTQIFFSGANENNRLLRLDFPEEVAIVSIKCDQPSVQVSPPATSPRRSHEITVRYLPNQGEPGRVNGALKIVLSDEDYPSIELPVYVLSSQ